MELAIILLFCVALTGCVVTNTSIIYALVFGLVLFLLYGKRQGFSGVELWEMVLSGIKTVKNILIVFVLIGMLTAVWRMSGTIPVLVCYASKLIHPSTFILMTFLLNCGVSVLTGTALGSAATMGVVCMTMGNAMDMNLLWVGGAVLSGVYFGDRCSPVSTSALLVAEVTKSDLFENIKKMYRTAVIPFALSCIIYIVAGLLSHHKDTVMDVEGIFSTHFTLHWVLLIPAVMILVLSACKVDVKRNMLASIIVAMILSVCVQHVEILQLFKSLIFGYHMDDANVGRMMNGGGILSMVRVGVIVCISSAYAGIFEKTGLLGSLEEKIADLGKKSTPFGAVLFTAIATAMITCNQALSIMLTRQLCENLEEDRTEFAVMLENSSVVVAPLIPWSVASVVPLTAIAASTKSILFACFLYLLPMCMLIRARHNNCSNR